MVSLSFTHPELLLLLPVCAAALWYSARVSYADLTATRRRLAWTVRGLLVCALILALAGARLMKPARNQLVVFALDHSASIPPEEQQRAVEFVRQALPQLRPQDRAAVVAFGREAVVEAESLPRTATVQLNSTPTPTHTDLSAALRLASGLIPTDHAGKVVLLSDGNENLGEVMTEALVAQANGLTVEVVPLRTRSERGVVVQDLEAPAQARRGEPCAAQVRVSVSSPTQGQLRLLVDDRPVSSRTVTLGSGTSLLQVPVLLEEPGFHKVEVQVETPQDSCRENNRAVAFVRVQGRPRVLLVDSQPQDMRPLREALAAQGIEMTVAGPEGVPLNPTDLEQYDCLLLSDLPSYRMGNRQMMMIRDAVRDLGMGLGMIGGPYAFGAGGYFQSPLEEALPVSMDLRKDRSYLPASVIIVMDTSGSMGMPEDGVEKIQLAAEAACSVVDLLQPVDAVGFLASDPAPTLISPIERLADKAKVKDQIRSVRAGGGGIAVYPSLEAAYGSLAAVKSPVRHVILLADGSDCDEQGGAVDLVTRMARERITVSAIAFGDGPHVPFLKEVAAAGKGAFYLTNLARDLKGIFTREAMTLAKSVTVEEPFRPRLGSASPVLAGLELATTPTLRGYVATTPKDMATVALLTHKQDPLLAHWQYGLGRSVAFTSDAKAHWAVQWLAWSEFSRFWAQTVRWCMRQTPSEALQARVELRGDRARLRVEAAAGGVTPLDGLEMKATVRRPGGEREEVNLDQTGPGKYEAELSAPELGSYMCALSATGPGGFHARQTTGFAVAYPPDLADMRTDDSLLAALAQTTGGRVLSNPAEAVRPPTHVPRLPLDMSRLLLWLVALLLPLDVAVRRLALRREDFAPFRQALSAAWTLLPRRRQTATPRAGTLGALRDRKQRERKRQEALHPTGEPPPAQSLPPPETTAAEEQAAETEAHGPSHTTSRLLQSRRRRHGP